MTRPPLFLVAALCLAAGCQPASENPRKAESQAITIVIKPDGSLILDGQPFDPKADLAATLKEKRSKTAAPPTPQVVIETPDPSRTSYEVFAKALLACGAAEFVDIEAAGVPFRLPSRSGCPPPLKPVPALLRLDIRSSGDVARLREHKAELKGCGLLICPCLDTPMNLVLAVAGEADKAGVEIGFAHSYYENAAERDGVQIVLLYVPLDRDGHIFPGLVFEDPFPDVASNNPPQAEFFGIPVGDAHKIVFVLDGGGSISDSIDFVKYELKRSIGNLEDKYQFHVIFYKVGLCIEMPARRLVPATERNKQLAFEFIDGVITHGQSDPSKALERAIALEPEVINLLTDGELDKALADLCKRLNPEKKVKINTICFLYKIGEEVLKQIAADSGGTYMFVSEADLEKLTQP